MMELATITALAVYLGAVGWLIALYQYRRAEEYRRKWHRAVNRELTGVLVGAGATLMDHCLDALSSSRDK